MQTRLIFGGGVFVLSQMNVTTHQFPPASENGNPLTTLSFMCVQDLPKEIESTPTSASGNQCLGTVRSCPGEISAHPHQTHSRRHRARRFQKMWCSGWNRNTVQPRAGHSRIPWQILTAQGRSTGWSRLGQKARWKAPLTITPRRREEGVQESAQRYWCEGQQTTLQQSWTCRRPSAISVT